MKSTMARHFTRATLLAAAVLAVCFSAVTANAQSAFQGKFSLPHEVRWGQTVLPAGDYLITFNDFTPTVVFIRDAKTLRTFGFHRVQVQESNAEGESALLLATHGKQRVVHSLRIAEIGRVFVYDPALARARPVAAARQAQAIPVLVAKK